MIEELGAMFSGKFVPYHKTALFVAALTAFIFTVVFGHSVVFEAPVAVIDLDRSATSARLIERINASNFIDVTTVVRAPTDPAKLTAHDNAVGVLVIPNGLEESLVRGHQSIRVGYFADYSNSAQNAEVLSELSAFMPEFGAEFAAGRLSAMGVSGNLETSLSALTLSSRELFNPTLQASDSTIIGFVIFFPSLYMGLTSLMIVGRLKVTGMWHKVVMQRSALALIARIVPYAFFYMTGITFMISLLTVFSGMRFAGSPWLYMTLLFFTGMALGMLAMLLSWRTTNPGGGAALMIFLVPPGFIMGGATMATGYLPQWAYQVSYTWPLVWQFSFYRDLAQRGETLLGMLEVIGKFGLYLTVIAMIVTVVFYVTQRRVARDDEDVEQIQTSPN